MDSYFNRLLGEIKAKGKTVSRPISSVYIGGGTPTVAGGKRLYELLKVINNAFNLLPNAEITVEANPGDNLESILPFLKKGGCNRLSLGVQSANQTELNLLRRRHNLTDVENAVNKAREIGINNISLDLMLGLPDSNLKTLKTSLEFLTGLNPEHISAYILKFLGRVCMDQFMVDVTEIPEAQDYDMVTLVGKNGAEQILVEDLSALCGRFNYEFVCDITKRVPRTYVYRGQVTEQIDYYL